jgi:hypothetical protein
LTFPQASSLLKYISVVILFPSPYKLIFLKKTDFINEITIGAERVIQATGWLDHLAARAALTTGKKIFAECQIFCQVFFSGTRQRPALGKEALCRVPCLDTRQRSSLPSVYFRYSAKIIFKSYFKVVN